MRFGSRCCDRAISITHDSLVLADKPTVCCLDVSLTCTDISCNFDCFLPTFEVIR